MQNEQLGVRACARHLTRLAARAFVAAIVVSTVLVSSVRAAPAKPAMSLEQALTVADRLNPDLAASRAELDLVKRRIGPAAPGQAEAAGAKPPTDRVRNAAIGAAEARLERLRMEVAAEVRAAFASAIVAREIRRQAEETRVFLESALTELERGKKRAAPAALEVARVAVIRARQEVTSAETHFSRASSRMLLLLGAGEGDTLRIAGELADEIAIPGRADVLAKEALAARPDVRAARLEREVADGAVRVGELRRAETPAAPADLDAELRLARAERTVRELEASVQLQVASALNRARDANAAVSAYLSLSLVPPATARAQLIEAYRSGAMSFVEIAFAARESFEAARQHFASLEALAEADANLRLALGER